MVSVGLNGTGQVDLARHYHGITAMRLLQGRKIWALRPPLDPECMRNAGECTDPFDVCAYYARPSAPAPACVQEAGDTIVVPDGWHHGTCNAADTWTVGWGGQNRRLELDGPRLCFHCRPTSRLFASSDAPIVAVALATAVADDLAAHAARSLPRAAAATMRARIDPRDASSTAAVSSAASASATASRDRSAHAPLLTKPLRGSPIALSFRGLFMQFLQLSMDEAVRRPSFMDPECLGVRYGPQRLRSLAPPGSPLANRPAAASSSRGSEVEWASWLRSDRHVYVYAPLGGADAPPNATRVSFRHPASGEIEERLLVQRSAVAWAGDVLHELAAGAWRTSAIGVERHDAVGDADAHPRGGNDSDVDELAEVAIACRMLR